MVQHLYPRFLVDHTEYSKAKAYWRDLWEEAIRATGQQQEWQHPWLQTGYADGTPFQDGDPIFSAWSRGRQLGVRVIQNEPQREELELECWTDTVGDEWTGIVRTLVISCALSDEAAALARQLILSWIQHGYLAHLGSQKGPPAVGVPEDDPGTCSVP